MKEDLIPQQHTGKSTNIEDEFVAKDEKEAQQIFDETKHRLLNVNRWHELTGPASAVFELTDGAGEPLSREAGEGDYFKIDIPGPGTIEGKGYDWVRVEKIEEEHEGDRDCVLMRVRPAKEPATGGNTTHFFTSEATSNFMVERSGNTIKAAVYGRNEKPNTETSNIIDKTRNTMIALGAFAGFSELQWKMLVKSLLGKK